MNWPSMKQMSSMKVRIVPLAHVFAVPSLPSDASVYVFVAEVTANVLDQPSAAGMLLMYTGSTEVLNDAESVATG